MDPRFIYLVVNGARPVARRELLDVLWPDEFPLTADTTLTGVLSRLRHVVGENVLQGRGLGGTEITAAERCGRELVALEP